MPLAQLLHDPRLRSLWRALLLAMMLAVCWLAFTPTPRTLPLGNADKVEHAFAFGLLAVCALLADGSRRGAVTRAAIAMLVFGVFIEVVQTQIPGRSGDAPDLIADALGIAVGLALVRAARRRFPSPACAP